MLTPDNAALQAKLDKAVKAIKVARLTIVEGRYSVAEVILATTLKELTND